MTTPAYSSPPKRSRRPKPKTSWTSSTKPLIFTACPHPCSPTTAPCSPPHHARARYSYKQSSSGSGSPARTPAIPPTNLRKEIERLHQTLKRYLARQKPAKSLTELQAQLDTFVHYYNNIRPHRALDGRTPLQAYNARIKARPATGASPATHFRIRQDKVDSKGKVTLRHNSRPIKLLIADRDIRIIDQQTGELLRQLTLNPNRDYQPINQP